MKTKAEKLQSITDEMETLSNQELSKMKGGKRVQANVKSAEDVDGGTLEEVVCTPDVR